MDVSEPAKLDRGMNSNPDRMTNGPERPVIEQDNDIDAPFAIQAPTAIPDYLQAEIQYRSVDPEPEEQEPVVTNMNVEEFAEENPNSRFQLVNTAIHAPGTCILCKSAGGDGRQFLDLGIQITWVGALYFCTSCVTEAASLLKLNNEENYDQIVAAHNEMVEKYNQLLAESMAVENATRTLLRNCHCEPVVSGESFTPIDVEANKEPESNDSDSDESSSVEESGDIPEASVDPDVTEPEPKPRSRARKNQSTE